MICSNLISNSLSCLALDEGPARYHMRTQRTVSTDAGMGQTTAEGSILASGCIPSLVQTLGQLKKTCKGCSWSTLP
jgi:hypothetical protein